MLTMINGDKVYTLSAISGIYPNCKVLMSELDRSKFPLLYGKVYAVSTHPSTMDALIALRDKLLDEGTSATIIGSYNEEGFVGVQYFADDK